MGGSPFSETPERATDQQGSRSLELIQRTVDLPARRDNTT